MDESFTLQYRNVFYLCCVSQPLRPEVDHATHSVSKSSLDYLTGRKGVPR